MKPVFAKILEDLQREVFAIRITDLPYFSTEFHFHNECQINYIIESEGKRIIGDNVETFKSDELTLLGPDLPHVWYSDKQLSGKRKKGNHARSMTLFFNPDKLLEALSHFGPVKRIESLLKKASRGMKFSGHTKLQLKQLMMDMMEQSELTRLITFIKMLGLISTTKEFEFLASDGYINTYQAKDNDRIDKVFKYVLNNFSDEIKLDYVAKLANMNKQAFCRYFKTRTQKTFVQFVNEVRVGHACKLITNGKNQIASLAYDCGFNSLSNFNRFFKEVKGVTPREYRKMIDTE